MDDYSLLNVYNYILELVDKKGSDFFQLPDVLKVFRTETYDFIGEHIAVLENTQQVTEDLKSLMKGKAINAIDNPEDPYSVIVGYPDDMHHLASVNPIFKGGVAPRRTKVVRHGSHEAISASPFEKPTISYPLITQFNDYLKIESGFSEKALKGALVYVKKPVFATTQDTTKRIVDLRDVAIEAIIKKVEAALLGEKADQRTGIAHQESNSFRNLNR